MHRGRHGTLSGACFTWSQWIGEKLTQLSLRSRRRGMIFLLFLCSVLALYFLVDHSRAQVSREDKPEFLTGWHLGLPKERLEDTDGIESERTLGPGQLAFIPAGSLFTVEARPHGAKGRLAKPENDRWDHSGGELQAPLPGTNRLVCRAPEAAGLYRLKWEGTPTRSGRDLLTILVLARAQRRKSGSRTHISVLDREIGVYRDPCGCGIKHVEEHAANYTPPRYFVRIDAESEKVELGEGLRLGQLVGFMDRRDKNGRKIFTNQRHTDVFPPNRALIQKLTALRSRLREQGVRLSRFWITSGFRTPAYNKRIGGATFSRHCYGDAADLCIDENGDKHMDDLNGDGKLDRRDGSVIARACLELEKEGKVVPGGIGVYEYDGRDSVRSHVHIDCRGFAARWGQARRGRKKTAFNWWSQLEKQSEKMRKP